VIKLVIKRIVLTKTFQRVVVAVAVRLIVAGCSSTIKIFQRRR
jgi:hypothetical protein